MLGGRAAVGQEVEDALTARGLTVTRVAGADRYGTAAKVGGLLTDTPELDRVVLAAGRAFPDALVAATPAARLGAPILLTEGDTLPSVTAEFLAERAVEELIIVGGTAVVRDTVAEQAAELAGAEIVRLAGPDRYATAAAVNEWAAGQVSGLNPRRVLAAAGSDFPDALTGGPLGARRGELIVPIPPRDLTRSEATAAYLNGRSAAGLDRITLLGGTRVLTRYQQVQLDRLVGG